MRNGIERKFLCLHRVEANVIGGSPSRECFLGSLPKENGEFLLETIIFILIFFSKGKNILGSALHLEYSQVNDFLSCIFDISATIMEEKEMAI